MPVIKAAIMIVNHHDDHNDDVLYVSVQSHLGLQQRLAFVLLTDPWDWLPGVIFMREGA